MDLLLSVLEKDLGGASFGGEDQNFGLGHIKLICTIVFKVIIYYTI